MLFRLCWHWLSNTVRFNNIKDKLLTHRRIRMRGRMFLFLVLTLHISLPNYIFVYNDTTYTIYAPLLYSSWYAHYLERSVSLLFIIVYNFPNGKLLYISYAAHREKGNIFFYYYQSRFSVATHNYYILQHYVLSLLRTEWEWK